MSTRYILITECLQNDFFVNAQCNLNLPLEQVGKMILGRENSALQLEQKQQPNGRIALDRKKIMEGPLARFLQGVVLGRDISDFAKGGSPGDSQQNTLHIINVRDWHEAGQSYDAERLKYGPHCEAKSWGADCIEGLAEYLDPGRKKPDKSTAPGDPEQYVTKKGVHYYQVFSDSIFDFKPRHKHQISNQPTNQNLCIELEDLMDVLAYGSEEQVNRLEQGKYCGAELQKLAQEAREDPTELYEHLKVYIAVIGVYTDIKVQLLLAGLQSRYSTANLAVSDTLTASSSLERHLCALDFADKLLSVDVIHGLNDLIKFLGGKESIENELEIVSKENFSNYSQYFQDKQNVLAYQDVKLGKYVSLTQKRSEAVYNTINWGNKAMLTGGVILFVITIVGAVLGFVQPDHFDWKLPAVTGGLSLSQLAVIFFGQPMARLQKNLTNLASFRMILENHSLKMALARFHLTTAETLRGNIAEHKAEQAAKIQVKALKNCIDAIKKIEESTYTALEKLVLPEGKIDDQLPDNVKETK